MPFSSAHFSAASNRAFDTSKSSMASNRQKRARFSPFFSFAAFWTMAMMRPATAPSLYARKQTKSQQSLYT